MEPTQRGSQPAVTSVAQETLMKSLGGRSLPARMFGLTIVTRPDKSEDTTKCRRRKTTTKLKLNGLQTRMRRRQKEEEGRGEVGNAGYKTLEWLDVGLDWRAAYHGG